MGQAVPARFDAHVEVDRLPAALAPSAAAVSGNLRLTVYEELTEVELDWRSFEAHADGTVFQTFDWLSTWQRHVGLCNGVRPAIIVARDADGTIQFPLRLSVSRRIVRTRPPPAATSA